MLNPYVITVSKKVSKRVFFFFLNNLLKCSYYCQTINKHYDCLLVK